PAHTVSELTDRSSATTTEPSTPFPGFRPAAGGSKPAVPVSGNMESMSYAIIEAPSILGLFPSGVEDLPEALFEAGLTAALGARRAGRLEPPPYESRRDPQTQMRNPTALRE